MATAAQIAEQLGRTECGKGFTGFCFWVASGVSGDAVIARAVALPQPAAYLGARWRQELVCGEYYDADFYSTVKKNDSRDGLPTAARRPWGKIGNG
jgi:hypothetical protein